MICDCSVPLKEPFSTASDGRHMKENVIRSEDLVWRLARDSNIPVGALDSAEVIKGMAYAAVKSRKQLKTDLTDIIVSLREDVRFPSTIPFRAAMLTSNVPYITSWPE